MTVRPGADLTADIWPRVALPQLCLDDLREELQHRLATSGRRVTRCALLEAVLVGSDLDLQTVLRRPTEAASTLGGARYAVLGVVGDDARLTQFVTVGIDDEERTRLGSLPSGHVWDVRTPPPGRPALRPTPTAGGAATVTTVTDAVVWVSTSAEFDGVLRSTLGAAIQAAAQARRAA